MQRLISDLLDLNRIERGTSLVTTEPINYFQAPGPHQHTVSTYRDEEKYCLKIENHVDEDVIITDPDALLQILDNLISNAIKFSFPGKEVKVKVGSGKKDILFEVTDQVRGCTKKNFRNSMANSLSSAPGLLRVKALRSGAFHCERISPASSRRNFGHQ